MLGRLTSIVEAQGVAGSPSATSTPRVDAVEQVYPVRKLLIEYAPSSGKAPHADLPRVEELRKTQVELARTGQTFLPPSRTGPPIRLTLNQIPDSATFSGGALVTINQALTAAMNARGFYGVWTAPASEDIDPATGRDLRQGRSDLRLLIYAAPIQQVRTIARGGRIAPNASTNNPADSRILENSPLQAPRGPAPGSLLEKPRLDEYVDRLNRFPGRTVAAAISAAKEPGGLGLEYLISEDRPWMVYGQVANTGTEASGDWRERFGFIDQQLAGHDDILSLDYTTADFEHSHAFFGSYEIPIVYPDRLKAKVYGSYSEFTADELGLRLLHVNGSFGLAGAELTLSPFSLPGTGAGRMTFGRFFVDFTLGARWQGIEFNNEAFGTQVGTDLVVPYAGVALSSISRQTKLLLGLQLEGNAADLAGPRQKDLDNLGRLDADRDWVVAKWGAGFAFFVDPFFGPDAHLFRHELSFSSHGQYALDNRRLIPEETEVIGGTYSVRGYSEAFDLGDTVYVGTAEYRFYLARALRPPTDEKLLLGAQSSDRAQFDNPFRFRSKDIYSAPRWDLILRAFVDGGQSFNNRRLSTETDRSLLSTGVGIEFQLRRNLNLRADYGWVLRSERENLAHPVEYGHSRIHFSAMVAW